MSHAHSPDHPPHTIEEMNRDIEAVERDRDRDRDRNKLLKPSQDGIGPTLGGDLQTHKS